MQELPHCFVKLSNTKSSMLKEVADSNDNQIFCTYKHTYELHVIQTWPESIMQINRKPSSYAEQGI
jgi:hypothetical protein